MLMQFVQTMWFNSISNTSIESRMNCSLAETLLANQHVIFLSFTELTTLSEFMTDMGR